MEEEQEFRERLKSGTVLPVTPPPPTSAACTHRLYPEVSKKFVTKILSKMEMVTFLNTLLRKNILN